MVVAANRVLSRIRDPATPDLESHRGDSPVPRVRRRDGLPVGPADRLGGPDAPDRHVRDHRLRDHDRLPPCRNDPLARPETNPSGLSRH